MNITSKPAETQQVLKKCPICCNEVKDIAINNLEVLEMCMSTKVRYHMLSKTSLHFWIVVRLPIF